MPLPALTPDAASALSCALDAVEARTLAYLDDDLGLSARTTRLWGADAQRLLDVSALLELGGPIAMTLVFSAEDRLLRLMHGLETRELKLSASELHALFPATVAEVANIVAGHCTQDFGDCGRIVSLSPPRMLEPAEMEQLAAGRPLGKIRFHTPHGQLDVLGLLPRPGTAASDDPPPSVPAEDRP
jgi:CheY-specific phosphatase CheX